MIKRVFFVPLFAAWLFLLTSTLFSTFFSIGVLSYGGHTYPRSELSSETIAWVTWYNGLDAEEQLAVSYPPANRTANSD